MLSLYAVLGTVAVSPSLLWINILGLDPDLLLTHASHMPNLARLAGRGSLGYLEMEGVAFPEVFQPCVALERRTFDLPWTRELEIDCDESAFADALLALEPRAQMITAGESSRSARHLNIGGASSLRARQQIPIAFREIVDLGAARFVYVDIPGTLGALGTAFPSRIREIDACVGELIDTAGMHARIMVTSAISSTPRSGTIGLLDAIQQIGGVVESAVAAGGGALFIVPDNSVSMRMLDDLQAWTPFLCPVIAGVRCRPLENATLVEVSTMREFSLVAGAAHGTAEFLDVDAGGALLLAGPGVRDGAYLHLGAKDLLSAARQLLSHSEERVGGPLGHYLGQSENLGYLGHRVSCRLEATT